MSRPALWLCVHCRRPLGQVVNGVLDVFGPSRVWPNRIEVLCVCGRCRTWYDDGDPERERVTEFARRP